jgi:hypothetical protein
MTRYWISWVQPTEDYRPLSDPPKNQAVIGWWVSGYDSQDHACICALVTASSDTDAMSVVATDWPESKSAAWRFCHERTPPYIPGDRFTFARWMVDRERSDREARQADGGKKY